MGHADLHIHSAYSPDGTGSIPAILKYVSYCTDLDVIAITDHNTTAGVHQALELAPRYGIEVIPGCEISTADGHLIGLFISEPVPAGLPLAETVQRVGALGGLCVAPHPGGKGINSLSHAMLRQALSDPDIRRVLVGVETFNGGLVFTRSNEDARLCVEGLPVAQVGSSDAHVLATIGGGATAFEGLTAADVRRALITQRTEVRVGKAWAGLQALRQWLPPYLLRKLGWVIWNEDPDEPLRYARARHALPRPA